MTKLQRLTWWYIFPAFSVRLVIGFNFLQLFRNGMKLPFGIKISLLYPQKIK